MLTFTEVGLPIDSRDRDIWRFAQSHQFILLTGNRNHTGEDSLEQTISEENTPTSLPIITVSVVERLEERRYREQCAKRLAEVVLYIENYLGVGRLYIP
jgi:hypothetical protein